MAYRLHYSPDSANLVIHILLRELKIDVTLQRVDRAKAQHHSAAYRALNPQGLIPVLQVGELALFETAAIALYLSDTHNALFPSPHGPSRGPALAWLFYLSNTVHSDLRAQFYPHRHVGEQHEYIGALRAGIRQRLLTHFSLIDQQLAQTSGPFWDGEHFGTLDAYTAVLCRWAMLYPLDDDTVRLARDELAALPALSRLLQALESRDSVIDAMHAEQIKAPFFWGATPPDLPLSQVTG